MHAAPPEALGDVQALGRALRARRKQLGLSQTALAERVSLATGAPFPRQTLSNLERGLSGGRNNAPGNPEWRSLVSLCVALQARLVIDVTHHDGVTVEFLDPDV